MLLCCALRSKNADGILEQKIQSWEQEQVNYIVFDLEWNQAADIRTRQENSLLFEIIEIGAVKLNEKREQIDRKSVV